MRIRRITLYARYKFMTYLLTYEAYMYNKIDRRNS